MTSLLGPWVIVVATFCWAAPVPPLLEAARNGDRATVKALLDQKADPNAAMPDGTTALAWSAAEGHDDLVGMLLKAGADPNKADDNGDTPLLLSAQRGWAKTAALLLNAGAKLDGVRWNGETLLMSAVRSANLDTVRLVLDRAKSSVNARESRLGQTALMWAAAEGKSELITTLVAAGADLNLASQGGATALMLAARNGHAAAVDALTAAGATVGSKRADGHDALFIAATNGHVAAASRLIAAGADAKTEDAEGTSVLHLAARAGNAELVKLVLAKGAAVNAKTRKPVKVPGGGAAFRFLSKTGSTPLTEAAEGGHTDAVRALLDAGADPNIAGDDGTTPLIFAAFGGAPLNNTLYREIANKQLPTVQLLVERGAKLDAKTSRGSTALHMAATRAGNDVVTYLVSKGAGLYAKDGRGNTPMKSADSRGARDTAALLQKLMEAHPPSPPPPVAVKP